MTARTAILQFSIITLSVTVEGMMRLSRNPKRLLPHMQIMTGEGAALLQIKINLELCVVLLYYGVTASIPPSQMHAAAPPDTCTRIENSSPALKETECVWSLPVVAAPTRVTEIPAAVPFLYKVNMCDCPAPGPVFTTT
jgi:hypothetical protein